MDEGFCGLVVVPVAVLRDYFDPPVPVRGAHRLGWERDDTGPVGWHAGGQLSERQHGMWVVWGGQWEVIETWCVPLAFKVSQELDLIGHFVQP